MNDFTWSKVVVQGASVVTGFCIIVVLSLNATLAVEASGVIAGRLLRIDGEFLPCVRIEIQKPIEGATIPFGPMARVAELKTNRDGTYRIEFPGVEKTTHFRVQPLVPYYRLVDSQGLQGGGVFVTVQPGKTSACSLVLRPASYFAGVVVDGDGLPIPDVSVGAEIRTELAKVQTRTTTVKTGRFEIFDLPPKLSEPNTAATLAFHRDGYIDQEINNIYEMKMSERVALRIVLVKKVSVPGRLHVNSRSE